MFLISLHTAATEVLFQCTGIFGVPQQYMWVETKMSKLILHDHNDDGINRRGFLECMAWKRTGVVWTVGSGILRPQVSASRPILKETKGEMTFVQISDSHIGFNKPANPDVVGTLQATVYADHAPPKAPEFIIHTGGPQPHVEGRGIRHAGPGVEVLAKTYAGYYMCPASMTRRWTTASNIWNAMAKGTQGSGWCCFDQKGVHFVGLVNVVGMEHLGKLGQDQLRWLEADLKARSSSTPVVVFAHIPLWAVYPEWGWGTEDSAQALGYLEGPRIPYAPERPHSPGDAKSGRQCDLPYRDVHRVPATRARQRAGGWSNEGARRAVA